MLLEEFLIAGVVAIGLIAVVRALVRGFDINRRRPYDAGKPTGTLPVSPEEQVPPPGVRTPRTGGRYGRGKRWSVRRRFAAELHAPRAGEEESL